jgi:hypothetical protein
MNPVSISPTWKKHGSFLISAEPSRLAMRAQSFEGIARTHACTHARRTGSDRASEEEKESGGRWIVPGSEIVIVTNCGMPVKFAT